MLSLCPPGLARQVKPPISSFSSLLIDSKGGWSSAAALLRGTGGHPSLQLSSAVACFTGQLPAKIDLCSVLCAEGVPCVPRLMLDEAFLTPSPPPFLM